MFFLPQNTPDQEERQNALEIVAKEREPLIQEGMPTRHKEIPPDEQSLHLKTGRALHIDFFRLWINIAGTTIYNRLQGVQDPLERHYSSMWLFPRSSSPKFPLSDEEFAQQRFCGPQTSFLTRISVLPEWVPPTEDLTQKAREGQLYCVNYTILNEFQTKADTYFPKVMALLSCANGNRYDVELLNVDSCPITKETAGMWEYAKACFQVNDALYYYLINKTCGCFLFLEPIVLYFYAKISSEHPLYALLNPIFHGHANACKWLRKFVFKEGGIMGDLLPLTAAGMRDVVKKAYQTWTFESTHLKNKLKARGLLDVEGYAYAEDGVGVFDAIEEAMLLFANRFYQEDADVARDHELQAWLAATSDPLQGKVRGFPSGVTTAVDLAHLLTRIFYQFVFERVILNFSQYDIFSFMPNSPTMITRLPNDYRPATHGDVIKLMDSEIRTSRQLHATFVFCYELVQGPIWETKNLPWPLVELLEGLQKSFQKQKDQMRGRIAKRPSPYKYFILHTGFLK